MLELAGSDLGQFCARHEGQDYVGRETLFQVRLDAETVCGVHKDTGMLRRYDRLDDICNIVYIGECLHAEEDVVEWLFRRMCGIFGCSHDCSRLGWVWFWRGRRRVHLSVV